MSTTPVETGAQAQPEQQTGGHPEWVAEGMRQVAEQRAGDGKRADDVDDDGEDDSPEDSPQIDYDRVRAKIRKANREAKALRERAEAAEQQAAKAPDLERTNADLSSQVMRLQVALELGLPASLAARLQGSNADEVRADAEQLLSLVAPAPSGLRGRPRERMDGAAGGPADPFDPDAIARNTFSR